MLDLIDVLFHQVSYAAISAAFFAAFVLYQVVQTLFFADLRHIPGPLLHRVTSFPHIWHVIRGDRIQWLDRLHNRYGDVVLLEPRFVVTCSGLGAKTIYSSNSLIKAPFYDTVGFGAGHKHLLQLKDVKSAGRIRKPLLKIMAKDNLNKLESLIHRHLDIFIKGIEGVPGQKVDMLLWLRLLAFDIISEASFGHDFGQLATGQFGTLTQTIFDSMRFGVLSSVIPGFRTICLLSPFPTLRRLHSSLQKLLMLGAKGIRTYDLSVTPDFVMAPHVLAPLFSDEESLIKEVSAFMIAGSDTSSTTLLYLFYEIALRPHLQQQLFDELSTATATGSDERITREDVEKLSLFNACIKETLRLHPPVPGVLPRLAPERGLTLGSPKSSLFVPSGVVVSSSVARTQTHADVFDEPYEFRPERWLSDVTEDMKQAWMPFSLGQRNCVGMSLAWSEIYIVAATVLRRYWLDVPPETTPESMSMVEGFFTLPSSGKCVLEIAPRKAQ
ncbi:cytochrome P450 [Acaromyces ingoldii]|uniref:Cytochrome P450 n=1 Tax=Acaromyces ingoldii TaxID=215250 RepID=A0A316YA92_9BASI|nr:cytochrome P450 [Acaromyces ingoldii]PWN86770.1 cytochrome P450 [Acaromyces ingoldii]